MQSRQREPSEVRFLVEMPRTVSRLLAGMPAPVTLKSRLEHLESLELDKEALLKNHAALAPEVLGWLTPEERHQLYKMLRLRVVVSLDGTLDIRGVLADGLGVCPSEAS